MYTSSSGLSDAELRELAVTFTVLQFRQLQPRPQVLQAKTVRL
jgi:hypothetical protein